MVLLNETLWFDSLTVAYILFTRITFLFDVYYSTHQYSMCALHFIRFILYLFPFRNGCKCSAHSFYVHYAIYTTYNYICCGEGSGALKTASHATSSCFCFKFESPPSLLGWVLLFILTYSNYLLDLFLFIYKYIFFFLFSLIS
jgi:hypothetical protein